MNSAPHPRSGRRAAQQGAVLMITLILLLIISVVVVAAFTMSGSNLKSVGNVQSRSESVSAANSAIETIVTGGFMAALNSNTTVSVDMNKDGTADYSVSVAIPLCPVGIKQMSADAISSYEVTGGEASAGGTYVTDWELKATVSDVVSGASVVVREGVRIPLGESDYQTKIKSCGLDITS